MSAEARLLQSVSTPAGAEARPTAGELAEQVRALDDQVRRLLAEAPPGVKPYLTGADNFLVLALSSLKIAALADEEPAFREPYRPHEPPGA